MSRSPAVMTMSLASGPASVLEQLGQRRCRQHALRPDLEPLRGRGGDALLDGCIHVVPEPLPQLAQQQRALSVLNTLLDSLLEALLNESLTGCHDDVLGLG